MLPLYPSPEEEATTEQALEDLAKEKQLTLSELLRYSAAASFMLFENKTPADAHEACLRAKSQENISAIWNAKQKWTPDSFPNCKPNRNVVYPSHGR